MKITYPKASLPKVIERLKKLPEYSPILLEHAAVTMGYNSLNNGATAALLSSAAMYGLIEVKPPNLSLTPLAKSILENQTTENLRDAAFRPQFYQWLQIALEDNIFSSRTQILKVVAPYELTKYNTQQLTTSYYNTLSLLCIQHYQEKAQNLKNQSA